MNQTIEIKVSKEMAMALEDWVLDEQDFWPKDTAFQRELSDLKKQIKTATNKPEN